METAEILHAGGDHTPHEKLRVGVPVYIELQALLVLDVLQPLDQRLCLRCITFGLPPEVLSARIRRGSTDSIPLEGPIAIDIAPKASALRFALSSFAPHPIFMGAYETCIV